MKGKGNTKRGKICDHRKKYTREGKDVKGKKGSSKEKQPNITGKIQEKNARERKRIVKKSKN